MYTIYLNLYTDSIYYLYTYTHTHTHTHTHIYYCLLIYINIFKYYNILPTPRVHAISLVLITSPAR